MFLANMHQRGLRWALRRLAVEVASPTSLIGRILRPLVMATRAIVLLPLRLMSHNTNASPFAADGDTQYFILDLETSPITYNVVDDLIAADMIRRRNGLKNLYVVIVPGHADGLRFEDPLYDSVVDRDARLWRLDQLVIPLFFLLPSCSGYTRLPSRKAAGFIERLGSAVYPAGYSVTFPVPTTRRTVFEMARSGEQVFPAFSAPPFAKRAVMRWLETTADGRKAIVVTLRQYGYMADRNSRVGEWLAFLGNLDPQQYCPIIVPDTEMAMAPVPGLPPNVVVFRDASWNQALRMALYESAWLNLATVHGPTELCWYNEHCRYLLFFETDTAPQTASALVASDGFEIGGQLPWASKLQKWVWRPDLRTTIQSEFDQMATLIERHETA